MDEFGVLVESIGFKPHGKSAPMAPKPKSHFATRATTTTTVNASPFHDSYSLPVDQLDGIFRSNVTGISKTRQSKNAFPVDDDIFGGGQYGGVDLDSVFSSSNNRNPAGSDGYDDLFGGFGVSSGGNQERKGSGLDDLLSGFGGATQSKNRVHSDDPFSVFEPSVPQPDASWPFASPADQYSGKGPVKSSSNGFGDFSISGPPRSGSKVGVRPTIHKPSSGTSTNGVQNDDYFDAIFGGSNAGQRSNNNNAARTSSTVQNSLFDDFFHGEKRDHVKQTSSQSSFSTNKASSATSIGNDFTSLFGDVTTSSGEFHEVKGEPTERRTARLKRHMKTNERMAEALAEKNQRDLEIQREQEEKHRLAETLDSDIKKWAAGKEGNLRALLCSLHQVLGAESGWRPVPLTDMITSVSVKKVYKKATLFVHPDKVQQRGASLHQKYVAEKVFDILKEASNKFSAEELR